MAKFAYTDLEGRMQTVETLKRGDLRWIVLFRRVIKLQNEELLYGEWRVADFDSSIDTANSRAESLKRAHRLPGYRIETAVVATFPVKNELMAQI
jgi:hypothetical protein